MKVTINLSDAQVKGIKAYLKEVADIPSPKKEDVRTEIENMVHGYLQSPQSSLTDYISRYEMRQNLLNDNK